MSIDIPQRVGIRLEGEQTIWLTTTRRDGMPLPNPVWFLWKPDEFLVLTMPESVKWKNMQRNPLVAFHFDSTSVDGSDVDIFQARAKFDGAPISDAEFDTYLTKYAEGLKLLGLTAETLKESFRPVRFDLLKYRTVVA